jgi:predicted phosphodiesterase
MTARCRRLALRILSDTHLERLNKIPESLIPFLEPLKQNHGDYNVMCLLGDIGYPHEKIFKNFMNIMSKNYNQVIVLTGNHEYYNYGTPKIYSMDEVDSELREFCAKNPKIHYLQNDTLKIGKYTVFGSTMWTKIYDKITAKRGMSDYRNIYVRDKLKKRLATVNDLNKLNEEAKQNLDRVLKTQKDVLVLTHHSPLFPMKPTPTAHHRYYNSELVEPFHNNFSDYIQKHQNIKLWAFGHTHFTTDFMFGNTRVISNQSGYYHNNIGADINKVISLF